MAQFPSDPDFFLSDLGGDDGFAGSLGTDTLGYFAQDLADLLPANRNDAPASAPSQNGQTTQIAPQAVESNGLDLAQAQPTGASLPTPPNQTGSQYPHKFDSPAESEKTTSPEDQDTKQRRRRKPLNCQFCRQRKLKCDRQDPCSTCVKKKRGHMCFYTNKSNTIGGRVAKSKDLLENGPEQPSKPVTAPNPIMSGGPGLGVPITVDLYKDRAFAQKMENRCGSRWA
ncbi:Arabinolytic transcriptional activator araR [Yarrowia sp. B02]|nr:Arabinolytic transcriptional activator araR [Yarrowia sp. B02]